MTHPVVGEQEWGGTWNSPHKELQSMGFGLHCKPALKPPPCLSAPRSQGELPFLVCLWVPSVRSPSESHKTHPPLLHSVSKEPLLSVEIKGNWDPWTKTDLPEKHHSWPDPLPHGNHWESKNTKWILNSEPTVLIINICSQRKQTIALYPDTEEGKKELHTLVFVSCLSNHFEWAHAASIHTSKCSKVDDGFIHSANIYWIPHTSRC